MNIIIKKFVLILITLSQVSLLEGQLNSNLINSNIDSTNLKSSKTTKTITQKVEFKNVNAADLYAMFLSSKHHSNIRGGVSADISENEGTKWSIDSGHIYGKILEIVKGKLIVLSWRSAASTPE